VILRDLGHADVTNRIDDEALEATLAWFLEGGARRP